MASKKKIIEDSCRVYTDSDPVTIQAAITDYCVNQCFMCDHWKRDDKKNINSDVWINFLKSLKDTKTVFYTGGDSIIHKDINKIMATHLDLDIDFGFITTGFIPESIDMQLLNQCRFFNVSFDTIVKEEYEQIRGGIELSKVLDSIEMAKEYGVNVNLTSVISEKNVKSITKLIDYAFRMHIDLRLNFIHGSDKIDVDLSGYTTLFAEYGLKFSVRYEKHPFDSCYVPYYSMFIDANGDVYPCCIQAGDTETGSNMEPLGNIDNFELAKSKRKWFVNNGINKKCSNCLSSFSKINYVLHDFTKDDNNDIIESRNFY